MALKQKKYLDNNLDFTSDELTWLQYDEIGV